MNKKGERGIRTLDSFFSIHYTGFQDRGYQPLSHLSERHFLFYSSESNMTIVVVSTTICRKTERPRVGIYPMDLSIRIYEHAHLWNKKIYLDPMYGVW